MNDQKLIADTFGIDPIQRYSEPEAAEILGVAVDTLRHYRSQRRGGRKINCFRIGNKPVYSGQHIIDYIKSTEQCQDQNEEMPSNTSLVNGGYGADALKAEQTHGIDAGTTSRPDAQSESAWLEKILQKPKPNSTDGTLSSRNRNKRHQSKSR